MSRSPVARCSPGTVHRAVLRRRVASLSAAGRRQARPRSCLSRQRGGIAENMHMPPGTMATRSSRFVARATEPVATAMLPVTGCRPASLDRSAARRGMPVSVQVFPARVPIDDSGRRSLSADSVAERLGARPSPARSETLLAPAVVSGRPPGAVHSLPLTAQGRAMTVAKRGSRRT